MFGPKQEKIELADAPHESWTTVVIFRLIFNSPHKYNKVLKNELKSHSCSWLITENTTGKKCPLRSDKPKTKRGKPLSHNF